MCPGPPAPCQVVCRLQELYARPKAQYVHVTREPLPVSKAPTPPLPPPAEVDNSPVTGPDSRVVLSLAMAASEPGAGKANGAPEVSAKGDAEATSIEQQVAWPSPILEPLNNIWAGALDAHSWFRGLEYDRDCKRV